LNVSIGDVTDRIDALLADRKRLITELKTVTDGGQSLPTEDTKDLEVSVVSNCLIGVHPDSSVRIVQTPERMMILPQPVSSLFGKRAVSGTKKGQP
jgi:hypothetical protein